MPFQLKPLVSAPFPIGDRLVSATGTDPRKELKDVVPRTLAFNMR